MRISVITPTLNLIEAGRREHFLQAVESVRAQTHGDVEHLVVDGASRDGTRALIEEQERAGRIAGFVSEPDGGVYEAMNRGAALASGDYLMILNSDDFYHRPEGLAEVAAAAAEGCDFVASPVLILSEPPSLHRVSRGFYRILMRMPFGHPGMAVRRDTFLRMGGFDTGFRIAADYDLMLRLVAAGASSAVLGEAFASFRPGGLSAGEADRTAERARALKKCFDRVLPVPQEALERGLAHGRLPARLPGAILASPGTGWQMRKIALYQLLRSLRPERRAG